MEKIYIASKSSDEYFCSDCNDTGVHKTLCYLRENGKIDERASTYCSCEVGKDLSEEDSRLINGVQLVIPI